MVKKTQRQDFLNDVRRSKLRIKRGTVAKTILELVGVAGFVAAGVLAPNAVSVIYNERASKQKRWHVWKSIKQLEFDGFLAQTGSMGLSRFQLTVKGRDKVAEYEIGKIKIRKPLMWDYKWRLVIFDIRESKRDA